MRVVIGGILLLAVAMGIGRFVYTPMLPQMQQALGWTSSESGVIAMGNYAGYLVGALLLSFLVVKRKRRMLIVMLIMNVVTTLCMGYANETFVFLCIRIVSGISSAFIFILSSQMILNYIAQLQKGWWSGIFYSGVGVGIVFSSSILLFFTPFLSWRSMWQLVGLVSVVFSLLGMLLIGQRTSENSIVPPRISQCKKRVKWLIYAYCLEGVGYIVTGTFIVAIAKEIPTLQWNATIVWLVVGVAAIPSCWFWVRLAERNGYKFALALALFVQASGIIIPVVFIDKVGFISSAVLFGFTFMGITTLANTIMREHDARLLGQLTAVYALGQMVGPMIAGKLLDRFHFSVALVFATGCIVIASGIVIVHIWKEKRENRYV